MIVMIFGCPIFSASKLETPSPKLPEGCFDTINCECERQLLARVEGGQKARSSGTNHEL